MNLNKTGFSGVFLIEIEKLKDDRGFFARTFDSNFFEDNGLISKFVQSSISYNTQKGTLRGIHYQIDPYAETKLISCINGKIFDVLIDLRPDSKTFKKWQSIELDSKHYSSLYIPEGIAHGFQTLEDNSEIYYQMSEFYKPEFYHGVRFDDPNFGIKWPHEITEISEKDKNWKTFN